MVEDEYRGGLKSAYRECKPAMCCDDIDIICESNMTVLLYEWGTSEPEAVCLTNGTSSFASYDMRLSLALVCLIPLTS
jgi:hypothetical protein